MTFKDTSQVSRPIRVLALPAYNRRDQNPFQALLYDEVQKLGIEVEDWSFWRAAWRKCDIWHFHHPDTVVFPRSFYQALAETLCMRVLLWLARLRGIKLIWTIHDLKSHDGFHPKLERWFWSYFTQHLDAVVSLTDDGLKKAKHRFPAIAKVPDYIVPHGSFRGIYPNNMSKAEAREKLGIGANQTVILHYGLARNYKSLPTLIEVFDEAALRDPILLIAGRVVDKNLKAKILESASLNPRILPHCEWIAFKETQIYFNAADLVALPYRDIQNSGTAFLALSFNRPVLLPNKGSMQELRHHFGADFVELYEEPLTPEVLEEAAEWACAFRRNAVDWSDHEWFDIGSRTTQIYEQTLHRPMTSGPAQIKSAAVERGGLHG